MYNVYNVNYTSTTNYSTHQMQQSHQIAREQNVTEKFRSVHRMSCTNIACFFCATSSRLTFRFGFSCLVSLFSTLFVVVDFCYLRCVCVCVMRYWQTSANKIVVRDSFLGFILLFAHMPVNSTRSEFFFSFYFLWVSLFLHAR